MAQMKPEKVNSFQNESEKIAYELLKTLDSSFTIIYEPSIGLTKRKTPDFVILSKNLGLIVLDVKYVKLSNIQESNPQEIIKTNGTRMKNFYQIVKHYAYDINKQLIEEFNNNPTIVYQKEDKFAGKLTFPHSSGILLFIDEIEQYTKDDVAKILSLNPNDFIILNQKNIEKNQLEEFLKNLQRPFLKEMTTNMIREIMNKIYIESDVDANKFINEISKANISINKTFKEILEGTHFNKSQQLKNNIISYTKYAQSTLEITNKTLSMGWNNLLEELKSYKENIENEKFTIAIFGYFGSGKSTFLNTLMNTDKLPMDEDRSTATFTRLKHISTTDDFEDGDMEVIYKSKTDIAIEYKEAIHRLFFDEDREKFIDFDKLDSFKDELLEKLQNIKIRDFSGSQRDKIKNAKKKLKFILDSDIPYNSSHKVPKEQIKKYLTDDKTAFGISEVIYYLDNELLKDVEIVDTPGYGSENTIDTFKTQQFVSKANALILLTESKDAMSKEAEHKFLETYAEIYSDENNDINTDNLFIIANKIDESNKTKSQIIKSIKEKIEDNWEDSLKINDNHIFVISSKYHYDKNIFGKTDIKNDNIDEKEFELFIETYSKFLTENKDRELIKNSFTNIDKVLNKIEADFKTKQKTINQDVNSIKNKKEKFEKNKKEIEDYYNLYSSSISNVATELENYIKNELDKQKINDLDETIKMYIRYLESIDLKSDKANKKNASEFYKIYVNKVNKIIAQRNEQLYKTKIQEQMEIINKQIEKYSKELEGEYGIKDLDKKIKIHNNNLNIQTLKIEFEKGFIKSILDILFLGYFVNAEDYAKQMVEIWKNDTYAKIYTNLNSLNNSIITSILDDFKQQNNSIVNSIGEKLNALEQNLEKRIKDKEEYDRKIEKVYYVFEKLNKYKQIILKQEKELYRDKK